MRNFTSEFRELIGIYHEAAENLLNSNPNCDKSDAGAFAESILRQGDRLENIERMSMKVAQLCDSWNKIEFQLDSKSRDEVRSAMAEAKAEALRLNQVCENHRKILEAGRDSLGAELEKIGKRNQHLKSIQPVKSNYPKFIDSHC